MAKNNIPFIENVREILNKDVDFELIYADGKKTFGISLICGLKKMMKM